MLAATLVLAAGALVPGTGRADGACVADPAAIAARAAAGAQPATALPADLTDRLDAAVRAALPVTAAPGVIVGVQSPEGRWVSAYGLADPEQGAPMEAGMHTRIGSVTKTFTGTLILQLAAEGLLSLDDPISDYVAGIPNGDEITLRMLASMTSGLESYTRVDAFVDRLMADPSLSYAPETLVDYALPASPIFAPGARFDYSNTNTVLLGLVIEAVTETPVGVVLYKRILEPLGLGNTVWPADDPAMPAPFARGFTLQGNEATPEAPTDATNWNPSWGWTAGEMISQIDDLLAYGRALGTGAGLLPAGLQEERLTSFPEAGGYGFALGCATGWVGHTGELPGYNTTLFYDTGSDTTVVVQANSDIASGACSVSDTLADDPRTAPCSAPAVRVFTALAETLGRPFHGPQLQ